MNELASHGDHSNMSFFAFTATPKDKTLQIFGTKYPDGSYKPYHVYSMQQAIEEGFILDVLKNYMTYDMYYKIVKSAAEDPEVKTSKGMKAIADRAIADEDVSWSQLRNWGSESERKDAKNCFYPIYVKGGKNIGVQGVQTR